MPVFTLQDGAAMAYADEGAGPPVLLVHGWAAHGGFFRGLARELAYEHRVLTLTLRGHPGSSAGQAALTIETLGQDIAAFVESLDLRDVLALGWSMGAMALWAAAPQLEGRLSGLVVEEMGPKLTNCPDWSNGLASDYRDDKVAGTLAEISADWPLYVTRFAPRMFAPSARGEAPDLIRWAIGEMQNADPAAMAAFWASMAAQDFRTQLSTIATPMLAIHGADSQIYPDGATNFVAQATRNGARVVIPGAGHVPHLEAPQLFFEHVAEFAQRTRRAPVLREGAVQ